jgi:isopenicillin N synthase-like dioxygenase
MLSFDDRLCSVAKENRMVFERLMDQAHAATMLILSILSEQLSLNLVTYHQSDSASRTTLSMFRYPKQDPREMASSVGHNKHTDLGTLTFLLCEQWGLQVLSPQIRQWAFVAPKPGSAVVNVGDTLRFLSGLRFRSAIHQVAPMDEYQRQDRYSIVYFLRMDDYVPLTDHMGNAMTAREWHDKKFDVFREPHVQQQKHSMLTAGMEEMIL